MPVFNNSLAGAAGSGGAAGYKIEKSLRLNSSDQSKLTRTPSAQSNTKTWTLSWWMKAPEVDSTIFAAGNGNVPGRFSFGTNGNGAFFAGVVDNNSSVFSITTDAFFRDPSAWYHCCLVCDSTAATQADRFKIIVNGVRQTVTGTLMPQNQNTFVNTIQKHQWSGRSYLNIDFADGYLADIQFVDGQAIDPDGNFGEFDADTGVWNPIEYTGSYNATGLNYATAGSYSSSGSQVGGPLANAYDGNSGSGGQTSANRSFWGVANGTSTHSGFSYAVSNATAIRVIYNANADGSTISVNGVSKTANTPAAGNTSLGSVDFSASELNYAFTSIAITSPNSGVGIYVCGIELDGNLLVTIPDGVNGFHLNFSDNSSNTALGFDARVSGTRYSAFVTGFQSSYPPANMFDGSLSTFTLGSNGGGIMTFTPGTAIPYAAASGGVELYLHSGSQPDRFRINGGSWVNQTNASTGGWQTISTGDGSINTIEFQDNGNNAEAVVYAIRVNGTILTDPSGANDWTVNNLVAQRDSNGAYGATISNSTLNYDPSVIFDTVITSSYQDRPTNNTTVTFTGIPAASTSLRIGVHYIESGTMTTNGSLTVVNATSAIYSPAWYEPQNISYPFTLTSLTVNGGGASDGFGIGAIEVDGVVLDSGSGVNTDQLLDSPTNHEADSGNNGGNYATLSSIDNNNTGTLSNGNLDALSVWSNGSFNLRATIAPTSGKFYWEYTMLQEFGIYGGILLTSFNINTSSAINGNGGVCMGGGSLFNGGSAVSTSPTQAVTGDVMGFAWDVDNSSIEFFLNGSSQGTVSSIAPGTYAPAVTVTPHSSVPGNISANFGQRPFTYTPPTGYKSLCTTNLPDPTIVPTEYFDTKLYTGNGGTSTITVSGLGFSPDLVWIKGRSDSDRHGLYDTVRGATKRLQSSETNAEDTQNGVTAFNDYGFDIGNYTETNGNNRTYVGWAWDAGTSNTTVLTHANGTGLPGADCVYRANPSAGFSIVKVANPTSTQTRVHGLNKKPDLIICKSTGSSDSWHTYHSSMGYTKYINLNATNGASTSDQFGSQEPTSTYFYVKSNTGSGANKSDGMIYYIWTAVENFSAFGSYVGNGSADGPFIYTGFKVGWLMVKNISTSGETWTIHDSTRDVDNVAEHRLLPNSQDNETTGTSARYKDLLSNGFKVRGTSGEQNTNNDTYIYAAFAENPFKYTRAR